MPDTIKRLEKIIAKPDLGMNNTKILTAQEHALVCSSVLKKYQDQPYTPLCAIQDGEMTVEEAYVARKRSTFSRIIPMFFAKYGMYGLCILEDLDLDPCSETYGQTRRDPKLLNSQFYAPSPESIDASNKFPFKRDE